MIHLDIMIAATALAFVGQIVTGNVQEFSCFVAFGLKVRSRF